MNPFRTPTILVADDHRGFRESLVSFLRHMPSMEVIGETSDGQEAAEMALKLSPDIVLMDIMMPRLNGIEAASLIKKQHPSVRVILYSMHDLEVYDAKGLKTADRFIPKQRLFEAIPGILK